ncbi:alpha/beta hydrolase [Streptomyces sp. NPDC050617]|uniref:alpha/beta hydrolase n=1 Tax=Streptomyces sp. NPDC050617 TaxID=3154628 RepID=UPI003442F922
MDFAALKALKPSDFEEAADSYRAVSEMASEAKRELEDKIQATMRQSLKGVVADAALGQLHELAEDFHYMQVECGLVSTALNAFAADVRPAKKKLDAAVADAEAKNFSIGPDGSVSYPAAGDEVDGKTPKGGSANGATDETARAVARQAANFAPNPNFRPAQECANRIAEALKAATEVDDKWAPQLRKLMADDDLSVSDDDWADVRKDMLGVRKDAKQYLNSIKGPPKNGSPKDNAAWWKSLSEREKADYVSLYPAGVGALDGIPSAARDEANRTVLAESHGVAQQRLEDWLKKEPKHYQTYLNPMTGTEVKGAMVETVAWKRWNEQKKELEGRVHGMDKIASRFDTPDPQSRAYLLGFDNKRLGHAIVSIGNPDTADNVVTFVPGTGSKLGSVDGDIRKAELLHKQATVADPTHGTASILWLGYDAPQDIMGDATDAKYADNARDPLSKFLSGVQTAHGGHVNSTVLGHSYGTLVAGETMRDHPDLPVDNAVFVGSPGVSVNHAKDLHIPADHVWSATAKYDLINLAPPDPTKGSHNPLAYVRRLVDDHSILYGNDPTSDEFGGRTFKVADGKLPATDGPMPAHSQYWENASLKHLANIVTGGHS